MSDDRLDTLREQIPGEYGTHPSLPLSLPSTRAPSMKPAGRSVP